MGLLRPDAIFYGLSREPDKNCATLAKKRLDMARSAVDNKIVTLTADSNSLAKIGSKVSVLTLH